MSISIATLGMFTPAGFGGSSGPIYIEEKKVKPIIRVLSVTAENTIVSSKSNLIEVLSIKIGD
jgi:hypothetical protein